MLLRDCVRITRCQIPEAPKDMSADELAERYGNPSVLAGARVGAYCLHPDCGFLIGDGNRASYLLKNGDSQAYSKYFLRKNDVMLATTGGPDAIGRCGFVFRDPEIPTTPASAFYILRIRDERMDPAWLYWLLRSKETRGHFGELIGRLAPVSTNVLRMSVEEIEEIPVRQPSRDELENVLKIHERLVMQCDKLVRMNREIARTESLIRIVRPNLRPAREARADAGKAPARPALTARKAVRRKHPVLGSK